MFIQASKQIEHQLDHNLWDLQSFKRGNSIFCGILWYFTFGVGRGECVLSLFVFSEFFPLKKKFDGKSAQYKPITSRPISKQHFQKLLQIDRSANHLKKTNNKLRH
jgi:hypothetical protein